VIAQRVSATLVSLQLSNIAKRRASQLSGGERRRVAIGRAIVLKPRVLLLDEPLVSLDPELKKSIAKHIRCVHDEIGATTVFVTHDENEANELSDRVVTMEQLNSDT
jgi:ABC-type sulfate/molybdate transport systems ATPase subunit